ncbi:MAG: ATP-dependent DNA helicase RecG [Betaproteobacteria bacterium]|nr:ATP-dependent DNA helicase RecG [Rhodocyclaceae bacterium]
MPSSRSVGDEAVAALARALAVAPTTARRLLRLGIARPADLVLHFPLRYEDRTRVARVADLEHGRPAQVDVDVLERIVKSHPRRQLQIRAADQSGELWLRFFHVYPGLAERLAPGSRHRVYGEPRFGVLGAEMVHPRLSAADRAGPLPTALTPVYPSVAGLSQTLLRRLVTRALGTRHAPFADTRGETMLADTLPAALRAQFALPDFAEAVRCLHTPPAGPAIEAIGNGGADMTIPTTPPTPTPHTAAAWRRIKFDELLAQQLSLAEAHALRARRRAPVLAPDGALAGRLVRALPFSLTAAQMHAWREIARDLVRAQPMQRLLQGDVGCGKTLVAVLAALAAVEGGHQAAVMAPTELLAEQHARKFREWLEPLGVRIELLTAAQPRRKRQAVCADIAAGRVAIAIGTHALLEAAVDFERLGLAVIDEQHRFGVRQRLALSGKRQGANESRGLQPHLLMLSATPIPRTLAMSYFADLDITTIDALPPERKPVTTRLFSERRRAAVIDSIRRLCGSGEQVYWVCPLIEDSEHLQLEAALGTFERLRVELPGLRIGLVHGRLKNSERTLTMHAFAQGEIDVLVATTVIEVGVDVANATLMVIEHAERFGLAQLHQLRGRVGRGSTGATCVLLYGQALSATARARLKIVFECSDGFEIARRDLLLRGPGEFLGARQSGEPLLRFAHLEDDADLLELARAATPRLRAEHPDAVAAHLARWLPARAEWLRA